MDSLFQFLDSELEAAKTDERTCYCVKLCAEELFTNMIRHNVGNGAAISVSLDISEERIRLVLVDDDVEPFDPDSVPSVEVDQPAAERQPGGLGMHLVRSIVDRVSYEYQDRRMTVSVVKRLAG